MTEPGGLEWPRKYTPEQQEVLSRSPYLRTFLETDEIWMSKVLKPLEPLGVALDQDIRSKLGYRWIPMMLTPLVVMAEEQDMLDKETIREEKFEFVDVVSSLFYIGYELGNQEAIDDFIAPIVEQLIYRSLIHRSKLSKDPLEQVTDYVYGIVRAGHYAKFLGNRIQNFTQPSEPPANQNTASDLDIMRDFIQGLDEIDDIGKS